MICLEHFHDGRPEVGVSFLIQLAKCLQQVAVDGGIWHTAGTLLPEPDPLGKEVFGGEEAELEAVHRYQRGVRELQQHLVKAKPAKAEDEVQ